MPMASVTLRPGVNTQKTKALNEAGVSVSNLIRYKDQLIQKTGGWTTYYPITFTSTIREIWAWQGATGIKYVAVGTTASLSIIQSGSLSNITPQTRTSDFTPAFSVSSGGSIVTVVDPGSSTTLFDTVFFNTQVDVGGIILQGAYPINSIGGSSSYTVVSTDTSSVAIASSGILPIFTSVANSGIITVTLPSNGYQSITGLFEPFIAPTSLGGNLTIQGRYQVKSVVDSTNFTIVSPTQATSADTKTMNTGLAEVVYYITEGPPSGGSGYGIGGYGLGGYGMGSPVSGGSGTPITATDWTMDNWGEVLIACPKDGPIYTWAPDSGFTTASVINTGPFFNGGIFISMPQQILVAWRSCQSTGVQSPLIVRWSDADDYTNWTVSNQTSAGSFTIPTGSIIMGGMQAPNYGVIWTDVDVWIMQYAGGDVIFNFTRRGNGCGLIGPHAACKIAGNIMWCGTNNFYTLSTDGVAVVPCPVWDFIFQNLDTTNQTKIRCAPNSTFGEVTWYFPSIHGNGENDSYVKLNIAEGEWDYGTKSRNAWVDVSAVGNPISADTVTIYQEEQGYDASGTPINSLFQSGFWAIAEGEEMSFVDWFLPDMKFGTYSGTQNASVQITFSAVDYVGDTPRTAGPFTFTSATEFLSPRLRGRFMSITVQSNDLGTFWRIGRCRYRYAITGRR